MAAEDSEDRAPFAILIMPNAHRQILEVSTWWRKNRQTAPRLFDEELDRALLRLARYPGLGTRSRWPRLQDVRRLLVRRVEYVVFYRLRPMARRIEVLAVWHARRGGASHVRTRR
ncbi:MAG TPA: type II toxin-antitoxin system RelE/ParE family toxin [Kofleriaceae bacterium]|nr:type II toxin-antitoxin system RelE/ParE family toxin [Kofleriaceae bacterium]